MGGLGKTTLAQMVVNNRKNKSHFEPIIWVNVSPDFNVKRVIKLIIESISKEILGDPTLDSLQKKVCEVVSGKRYLLVLDDVWNEDQEEWDKLKYSLSNGLPGSCILATTRSEKVASIMRALPTPHLTVLSKDDCWLLFRQRAFELHKEERPDLVAIGKDIVQKCGGVPLAAKALGGLMRTKMGVKEWVNIKESDLWDLPQGEVPILPALRLSYYNLPLELRHCFSYCAVFSKGSRMKKDKMIQLWMANGYISSRGKLEVEDVGSEVWNELHKRSLFLDDKEYMFMHDLVHDLARSIIEDEFYMMEAGSSSITLKKKIRHASLVCKFKGECVFPKALRGQQKLHSVLFQHRRHYICPLAGSQCEFSCDFKNFGSLRVFDASGAKMMQLSKSIGNAKHLTYLNLSGTTITELPASICSLHHLQTINLNDCRQLQRLPKEMHRLTDLRHLCLEGCFEIEDMPPKIGKLTQLKTLSFFIVGESDGQSLGELRLLDLGGELRIRHLERVRNSAEPKEANLDGKDNIRVLCLDWERYKGSDLHENVVQHEVSEALKPHPNIKKLTIKGYLGKEMPSWMSDPSVLTNVVRIAIIDCKNCLGLPALWHLPCLKCLLVSGGMDEMEYMFPNENNLSGGSVTSVRPFSSFVEVEISRLLNLKGLSMEEEEEGIVQQLLFPRLWMLKIYDCPQFLALPRLPALKQLYIWKSSSVTLLASISKLTTLTYLSLIGNQDMVSFPEEMLQNLTLLQSLKIDGFRALKVLPENMSSLVALQKLSITDCKELECLPDGGIGSLQSLLELWIIHCSKIVSLPDSIQNLTQLQDLLLSGCSRELNGRFEKGKGQDWYKIAHIPKVTIR